MSLFYLRPILALIAVSCLIGLVAIIAKKLRLEERLTSRVKGDAPKQLSVIETLTLDTKRRLVLIKRGNQGHLLLLSPQGDVTIEQNIALNHDIVSIKKHLKSSESKGNTHDQISSNHLG